MSGGETKPNAQEGARSPSPVTFANAAASATSGPAVPMFGTMTRPGVSFKSAVAQHVPAAKPAAEDGNAVTFGSFPAPEVSQRVQSAPSVTSDGDAPPGVLPLAPSFVPPAIPTAIPPPVQSAVPPQVHGVAPHGPPAGQPYGYAPPAYGGYYVPGGMHAGGPPGAYGAPRYRGPAPPGPYYGMAAGPGGLVPNLPAAGARQPPHGLFQPYRPFVPPQDGASHAPTEGHAPVVAAPPRKRIAIVNPETGEELVLGSRSSAPINVTTGDSKVETKAEPKSEAKAELKSEAKVEPKPEAKIEPKPEAKPAVKPEIKAEHVSAPVHPAAVKVDARPSAAIKIVDPRDNTPVELPARRALPPLPTDAIDDLLLDEDDDEDMSFRGSDDEDEEEDAVDVTGMVFPVALTRNMRAAYPPGAESFEYPPEGHPMRYTTSFLLQFSQRCRGVAQDIKAVAFPREAPVRIVHGAGGRRGSDGRVGGPRRGSEVRSGGRRGRDTAGGPPRPQVELTNRAADAWSRSSQAIVDADVVLLREVKGILNKLTEAKFEHFTAQVLSLDIIRSAVMTGVIDLLFDKAVEEPRYAPLYARLCERIVRCEISERESTMSAEEREQARANPAALSLFRRYLVTKCQIEYELKRAYSKQRIERFMARAGIAVETPEGGAPDATLADASKAEAPKPEAQKSDSLTEEDYALIKLKRRVLGNMRFVGELFNINLISAKIMHSVIQELLADVTEPEEEEVESVCRLITTIGKQLDTPDAAPLWAKYVERMRTLSQHNKLPTRVRFMVEDVLEIRNHGWRKPAPGAAPTARAPAAPAGRTDPRRQAHGDVRLERPARGQAATPPARGSQAPTKTDGFNTPRDAAFRPPSGRVSPAPQTPSPAPSASSAGAGNRFRALGAVPESPSERAAEQSSDVQPELASEKSVDLLAEETEDSQVVIGRITSTLDEALKVGNVQDVVELFMPLGSTDLARDCLAALILHAMDAGRKAVALLSEKVLPTAAASGAIARDTAVAGCRAAFEMIDDLVVDVPQAYEHAGTVLAALFPRATDAEKQEKLMRSVMPDVLARSPTAVGRVALHYVRTLNASAGRSFVLGSCASSPSDIDSLTALAAKLSVSLE